MPAPEPAGVPRSWRAIGRILPRSIREGVYEPAYLDLWRATLTGKGGNEDGLPAVGLTARLKLACYLLVAVWYALPRYLTEVPSSPRARWARRLGFATMIVAVLLVVLPRLMRYAY